jgi:hypothetical protein
LELSGSHILNALNMAEMLLVRVDMLFWVLLDGFLTDLRGPRFLLLGLSDHDLIGLLLPIVEPHLLLRHISILKSNPYIPSRTYPAADPISQGLTQPYIPYLLHHHIIMSNNLARRTPRNDTHEPKRRKEATIELTSD